MNIIHTLSALLLAATISPFILGRNNKSIWQPVPAKGFWVTESTPDGNATIVRYYAYSNHLITETMEFSALDISRLKVRRSLNRKLRKLMENDSISANIPVLYEIR